MSWSRAGSPTGRSRRRAWRMTRHIKRGGKVWIRIFPDKPITKKPAETRMGKGKGNPEGWVAVVKPGRVMFEIEGITRGSRQEGDGARRGQAAGAHARSSSARRAEPMKPNELREMSLDDLTGQARGAGRGAVQPALPLRDRIDRESDALPGAAPRHRAASRRSCASGPARRRDNR